MWTIKDSFDDQRGARILDEAGLVVAEDVPPKLAALVAAAPTLLTAVQHVLRRAQTEPEFRWHMLGTESFELLTQAEAAACARPVEEVRAQRERDLQPTYRYRLAWCREDKAVRQYLEARLGDIRERCTCGAVHGGDDGDPCTDGTLKDAMEGRR